MSTNIRDSIILHASLWGMDDTDYRILRNAMIVTRQTHECAICFETIPAGTRVRAQTEVYDGNCKTFRICPACCKAFVLDHADNDCEHVEARTELGRKNCEAKQAAASAAGIVR